jgi:hypothetical protein
MESRTMTTGLSKLAVLVTSLLAVAILALSLAAPAGAAVRKTSFELDGDLSRFDAVNVSGGTLNVGSTQAYGSGTYSAHASYAGGGVEGAERGVFNVSWESGDDVWYDAAFYLPPGFKQSQSSNVDLLRWDNWPTYGSASDYGGISLYGSDHKARLVHG